jgi:AcrR family transcriptional regulator
MTTEPRQLRGGRHGLQRSFVVRDQRERVLAAVADVFEERGYHAATIEDIIRRAGVSRRTFYDQFSDKNEVFLLAYDAVSAQCMSVTGAAYASSVEWPEQVRRGLRAFMLFLENDPAFTRMGFVDIAAAGPEGIARRNVVLAGFQIFLAPGLGLAANPVPDSAAAMIAGGIYEMIYARVVNRRITEISQLLPTAVYLCLSPYLGLEAATLQADLARAEVGE